MVDITLEELKERIELLSPIQMDFFSENCIVALESCNHSSGCVLEVSGDFDTQFRLNWNKQVNKSGYKEKVKRTEHAAEAVSFFLSTNLTKYTVIEEATIGTGFDYWLGYDENHIHFNPRNFLQARLEISGIERETAANTLERRVREKKKQTSQSDSKGLPAYISVVEFSMPKAFFGKK